MLEDRDELIDGQEEELLANQNRIISLNGELRNCLEAWEKEKAATLPARKQVHKIEEDLNKFQEYAIDLEKKTKETLRGVGSKSKDEMMVRMGQHIVELINLQNRAKGRMLDCVSGEEKIAVMKEYDSMR